MIGLKPQFSMNLRLFSAIAAFGASILLAPASSGQDLPYQIFERYLVPLASNIGMPGLSAVIVRNNRIEWEKGYGFADVENKVEARPDTPYAIGGVTQAMTAVLLGVCSDRHRDRMDQPIRQWDPAFAEASATVRQVLAHASNGTFSYNEPQFASLTPVVDDCIGQPYRVAIAQEILRRPNITSSVPGLDLGLDRPEGAAARALFEPGQIEKYQAILARVAKPYRVDARDNPVRSEYPTYGLDAAGGMVASARDLAEFEIALNDHVPLSEFTLRQMWKAATFNGVTMPTGLGWFVQTSSGQQLVWTFGHIPGASSALILRRPSQNNNLTLILLSNSDRLAATYQLEKGDAANSPFVKIFLRLFS